MKLILHGYYDKEMKKAFSKEISKEIEVKRTHDYKLIQKEENGLEILIFWDKEEFHLDLYK